MEKGSRGAKQKKRCKNKYPFQVKLRTNFTKQIPSSLYPELVAWSCFQILTAIHWPIPQLHHHTTLHHTVGKQRIPLPYYRKYQQRSSSTKQICSITEHCKRSYTWQQLPCLTQSETRNNLVMDIQGKDKTEMITGIKGKDMKKTETEDEKNKDVCFCCGQNGHWARSCPRITPGIPANMSDWRWLGVVGGRWPPADKLNQPVKPKEGTTPHSHTHAICSVHIWTL